jgi:two-component system CheB/CheR fusion protein
VLETLTPKEVDVRTKNDVWYQARILPYRTTENRIDGLVVTFIDVNQIKEAEMELLKSARESRLLAAIVRDSNDAITVQSFDGKILEWNYGAETAYGYSKREALEKNIADLMPEDSKEGWAAVVKRIARGEPVKSFKTRRLCKSGKTIDVWLTITLIKSDGAEPNGFATTERDISNPEALEKIS